jgi:hypothetical protein
MSKAVKAKKRKPIAPVIEKDIEQRPNSRMSALTFMLSKMVVDDSFWVVDDGENNIAVIRSNISIWGSRHNKKFKTRRYKADGGWRIWRIK